MLAWKQQIRIGGQKRKRLCLRHCLRQEESVGTTERTDTKQDQPPMTSGLVLTNALASEYKLRRLNLQSMTKKSPGILLCFNADGTCAALLTPNAPFQCEDLKTIDSRQNVYLSYSFTVYGWEINSYPIALIWHKYSYVNICMEINMLRFGFLVVCARERGRGGNYLAPECDLRELPASPLIFISVVLWSYT